MDKLIAIQSELKAPKGQYNSFGKYKYRSAEDILEAVKPLCVKHNVLLTLTDSIELIGERYYVKATARVSDGTKAVEVTALAREDLDKKGMDGSQITGTASSYARKYALNGLFCIDDTKDADTDEYTAKTQGKKDPDAKKDAEKKKELESTAISAAEAKTLKGLIEMTGTDEKKLLKSYKAATIEALSKAQWAQAVKILSKRKEEQTSEVQDALFG
nr:MAG TPA: ERF superfamily protein [Caudoviricetes sp.]